MQNKVLEQEFNPEEYMNERLLEIADDTERKQLRAIMNSFFTPFYQYMEEKYQKLEQRMLEKDNQDGVFDIVTTICPKNKLIAYEDTMFPMYEEDLEEQYIKVDELIACLEEQKECFCYFAYGQMEYEKLQKLWKEKRRFKGKIKTADAEFEAYFILKKNEKYGKKIKELYEIFVRNQIPWHTLKAPFINKMIDVYVVEASYPEGEVIESIEVDFEEYKEQILFEMVPLWNIGKKKIRSSAYPAFEVDQVNFTHTIYSSQLEKNCQYLVGNDQLEYWNVRKESEDLCIECKEVEPVTWDLLEIHHDIQCHYKDAYPLMSNDRKTRTDTMLMRTLGELRKRIGELQVEDYLTFRELQKVDSVTQKEVNTYSMNEPIQEELQAQGNRPGLLFIFEAADKEDYLNGDVLSYVISSLQWELPEYECFGKIM
ncbi:MAG: hypothetical protein HDR22_08615 [Lachnospiraceae bacterium]|nr:hypothetical protein [Lachnospiraceae bacterium]